VDAGDYLQPLYRDIAAALRATQPEGGIILLASPGASTGIGYYGALKTLGTLFWENAAGLKAAGAIFCARTDDEAAALIRARGVTHIALISSSSFLSEYFTLLHPTLPAGEVAATFGHRISKKPLQAAWLQPIPYRKPRDLALTPGNVSLFRVDFDQTEVERLYHTTVALAAAGDVAAAEASLEDALTRVPDEARFSLAESVGSAFYTFDAHAAAVRALRRALAFKHDVSVATTLAWILATTADPALRDGRAALALVDPLVSAESSDSTVLSALAAALAEVGQFTQAVSAAETALSAARVAGNTAAIPPLQQRLDAYRANLPWRQ
jgi:hypothetical protein